MITFDSKILENYKYALAQLQKCSLSVFFAPLTWVLADDSFDCTGESQDAEATNNSFLI